jgi:dipeptidyl aminopeptidase/acylaminoacyl peptidase
VLPTVVLVHGGPYGRWGHSFHLGWGDWAQWLALAGYAVLMPNPRGGMGHGERFAAAARGDVGGADYRDVMSAVDAAVERGIADPERLGIGGWSQGGFMTAWAVTQTRRFRAGVMGAGVSDWGMMAATSDLPDFERDLGGSAPWDGVGPHRHAELSPISFARAVTTPVLILHGQRDERVPLSQAIAFHRALRERDVPCQLVVYPREPHGIGERAHQVDLLKRVRAWYDRWLRA